MFSLRYRRFVPVAAHLRSRKILPPQNEGLRISSYGEFENVVVESAGNLRISSYEGSFKIFFKR